MLSILSSVEKCRKFINQSLDENVLTYEKSTCHIADASYEPAASYPPGVSTKSCAYRLFAALIFA